MHKINFLTILLVAVSLSCTNTKSNTKSSPNVVRTDSFWREEFFSSLPAFITSNPASFDKNIRSLSDIKTNEKRFHFVKRVMLPLSFDGITFDYWTYLPCDGGCFPYNFLFIHNNANQFLLPLTDDHIFWENSNKAISDTAKATIFASKLNDFASTFSIQNQSSMGVLDIIMEFRQYNRIGLEDVPKLEYIVSKISSNKEIDLACKNKMNQSIAITENWIKEGQIVYSNGINVLMFTNRKNGKWEMETLNTDCNRAILF